METRQTNLFKNNANKPKLSLEDKVYIKLLKSGVAFVDHIYPSFICKDMYINASTSNRYTLEQSKNLVKRANNIQRGYYHIDSKLHLHRYDAWLMHQVLITDQKKYKASKFDKSVTRRILVKLQLN